MWKELKCWWNKHPLYEIDRFKRRRPTKAFVTTTETIAVMVCTICDTKFEKRVY